MFAIQPTGPAPPVPSGMLGWLDVPPVILSLMKWKWRQNPKTSWLVRIAKSVSSDLYVEALPLYMWWRVIKESSWHLPLSYTHTNTQSYTHAFVHIHTDLHMHRHATYTYAHIHTTADMHTHLLTCIQNKWLGPPRFLEEEHLFPDSFFSKIVDSLLCLYSSCHCSRLELHNISF